MCQNSGSGKRAVTRSLPTPERSRGNAEEAREAAHAGRRNLIVCTIQRPRGLLNAGARAGSCTNSGEVFQAEVPSRVHSEPASCLLQQPRLHPQLTCKSLACSLCVLRQGHESSNHSRRSRRPLACLGSAGEVSGSGHLLPLVSVPLWLLPAPRGVGRALSEDRMIGWKVEN